MQIRDCLRRLFLGWPKAASSPQNWKFTLPNSRIPCLVQPCAFRQYIDAVEAFSARKLTVATDELWAFSGVAKAFEP